MIKFGVFKQAYKRTEISQQLTYEFNHYKGQLVLGDGKNCYSLDDYWAMMKPEILEEVFAKQKEIITKSKLELPRLDWFEHNDMPIDWFDDHEGARYLIEKMPENFRTSSSAPSSSKMAS